MQTMALRFSALLTILLEEGRSPEMKRRKGPSEKNHFHSSTHALSITGVYVLLGTLWILFSDSIVVSTFDDPTLIARLQSLKGIIFVTGTGVLIYILLYRAFLKLYSKQQEIEKNKEQYRTTADYLRALFETAPLAIFDFTREGRINRLWNRAAEELFGWSRDEVIGFKAPFVPEEKWEEFEQLFESVLEGNELLDKELVRQRKDGTYININLAAVPLYDEHRRVTGVMSIVVDVSEKRKREEELEQTLDEKKVLLREVHHRVKNNLQVIISLLNMKEELVEHPPDRDIFFGILERVEAMALIHDKLYHAEGLEHIDFDAYLRTLSSNLALEYGARSRGITIDYQGENVVLEINRALPLGLLVNELLTNALKHAFVGGKGGTIRLRLVKQERQLQVQVADNGVGIPEAMLHSMGEPERTGLNLAYLFAEQVGGTLEIQTEHGTDVRVYC